MANHSPSNYANIGKYGEDLTAQWLISQGWILLHQQWHSRWGEIDIVAEYTNSDQSVDQRKLPILAFVEVKTRSRRNWDAGGRNAIAYQKQVKICRTAQAFLSKYPEKAESECRFDVAIVSCQFMPEHDHIDREQRLASMSIDNYDLFLQEYIVGAFDAIAN